MSKNYQSTKAWKNALKFAGLTQKDVDTLAKEIIERRKVKRTIDLVIDTPAGYGRSEHPTKYLRRTVREEE